MFVRRPYEIFTAPYKSSSYYVLSLLLLHRHKLKTGQAPNGKILSLSTVFSRIFYLAGVQKPEACELFLDPIISGSPHSLGSTEKKIQATVTRTGKCNYS